MKKRIFVFFVLLSLFTLTGFTKKENRTEDLTADLGQESDIPDANTNIDTDSSNQPTVKDLLSAAITPAGDCLYVWGGGWNEPDTGAGVEAMTLGVSPRWHEFFCANGSGYDYRKTRYQIHDGLDCSGFIGYVTYQVFENSYSTTGYVYLAGEIPKKYQELFGGSYYDHREVSDYQPGDIMGKSGHVFLIIGKCDDGSVLFVHASPPAVSLCGTPTPDGKTDSDAVMLAKQYMSLYRSDCYNKFDTCSRGLSYLTDYNQFRWSPDILADPDGYRNMSVEEILADLFGEYIKGTCQIPNPDGKGFLMGLETFRNPNQSYQYEMLIYDCSLEAWVYSTGKQLLSDGNAFWTIWDPEYGYYWTLFRVYDTDDNLLDEVVYGFEHLPPPVIKGICQQPYEDGYLIGIESSENPNQSYQYEMLILDCTLYAEGKDAWIYSTGKCRVEEGNALWTVWKPKYGYYWTLFRVYDADGNLLDEACYGFENI